MTEWENAAGVTSPLHHLALAADWDRSSPDYRGSTLGRSLEDEGFVHCSGTWQVQGIADAVYRGRSDVVLLTIDPERVGADVRIEGGYPHVYGPVPTDAVVSARAVPLGGDGRLQLDDLLPEVLPGWPLADLRSVAEAVDQVPAGVDEVRVDGATILRWQAHATSPTFGAVHAHPDWGRQLAEVRPEVERAARGSNVDEVWWWSDQPALDGALYRAGATLVLTQRVEARDLTGAGSDTWLAAGNPPGVTVGVVDNWDMAMAMVEVETAGWRRDPCPPEALAEGWAGLQDDLAGGRGWRLLGSIDGLPAAVGACRLVPLPEHLGRPPGETVARLHGAVTLPAQRRRGMYTAIVAARCRIASAHGARLALTRARQETAVPILERLGFLPVSSERCWVLPIAQHQPRAERPAASEGPPPGSGPAIVSSWLDGSTRCTSC
ncbi:MAG: DUF952 domain-containing protein [Actinomycetota bacterium]|nr:DUF952 domain-containing protein [Actinomycetota bacterium]